MVTVIYDQGTRDILVIDPARDLAGTPILPTGIDVAVAEISSTEAEKFTQEGTFTLSPDGQTVVVAAAPLDPNLALAAEREAASVDLQGQYETAIARLDQIIGASTPTNAQVVAAIRDLAAYQRKVLRLLHARAAVGGE